MIDNKTARKEIKLLKAMQGISYREFAEMIGLSTGSIYCFLSGQYNLGKDKLS